jgi:uncharacterized protein YlxW (UPF0749 family)
MKLKVQDHPGLYRDSKSKGIVVDDRRSLDRYLAERSYRQSLNNANQSLETELSDLKNEVSELKNLVQQLIRER